MPPLRTNKKLKPAKRAWKNFTEMLKSKFRDLRIATTVRDSTSRVLEFLSRRLVVPLKTRYLKNTGSRTHRFNYNYSNSSDKSSRVLEFLSHRLVAPIKRKCQKSNDIQRYRYQYNDNDYKYLQIQHQPRSVCSTPCVDRLYKEEGVSSRKDKVVGRKEEKGEDEGQGLEIVDSMEEAWRRVVAASPHLRVDERADEFIYKFREEIRIEKERSFLEFQERLKRSA